MPQPYRAVVLTISDSAAKGEREDLSGPAVKRKLEELGLVVHRPIEMLPDDFNLIRERLSSLASDIEIDAVFTTGGTGVSPRDRTPEATTSVMERSIAGLAELMRREGAKKHPYAALSRAVVGTKGKVLLVNLPGSPEGAVDSLEAIGRLLPHALAVMRGEEVHKAPAVPVAHEPGEAPAPPEEMGEAPPQEAEPASAVAAPSEGLAEGGEPAGEAAEAQPSGGGEVKSS